MDYSQGQYQTSKEYQTFGDLKNYRVEQLLVSLGEIKIAVEGYNLPRERLEHFQDNLETLETYLIKIKEAQLIKVTFQLSLKPEYLEAEINYLRHFMDATEDYIGRENYTILMEIHNFLISLKIDFLKI